MKNINELDQNITEEISNDLLYKSKAMRKFKNNGIFSGAKFLISMRLMKLALIL